MTPHMAPLIVMALVWLVCRALGAIGVFAAAGSAAGALRYALAAMFLFTAATHFMPSTRPDLVAMVPPAFPRPALIITITGVLELAGAVGLLLRPFTVASAYCLAALLIAMFPANVFAAREGLQVAGRDATPLVLRLPMQLFWIGALVWVGWSSRRNPTGARRDGVRR